MILVRSRSSTRIFIGGMFLSTVYDCITLDKVGLSRSSLSPWIDERLLQRDWAPCTKQSLSWRSHSRLSRSNFYLCHSWRNTISSLKVRSLVSRLFLFSNTRCPGLKKLKELESEIQRLTAIRHNNLVAVLAVLVDNPRHHHSYQAGNGVQAWYLRNGKTSGSNQLQCSFD